MIMVAVAALVNLLPFALMCVLPFRDRLIPARKKLLAEFILSLIPYTWVMVCVSNLDYAWQNLAFSLVTALYLAWYLAVIREKRFKLLFHALLVMDYGSWVVCIENYIQWRMYGEINSPAPVIVLIFLLLVAVTCPWMVVLLRQVVLPLYQSESVEQWKKACIMPALYLLLVLAVVNGNEMFTVAQFCAACALLALIMVGNCYSLLGGMQAAAEAAALREKESEADARFALQQKAYTALYGYLRQTRKARHDFRHHMALIQSMAESEDLAALRLYVGEYLDSLPPDAPPAICEHYVANAICGYYLDQAEKGGVWTDVALKLPGQISMSDRDLCALLGNLVENAVEACFKCPEQSRWLRIRGDLSERGEFVFMIANSAPAGSREAAENGGIGLSSVRAIVERYHGVCRIEPGAEEFRVSVLLDLSAEKYNPASLRK